MVLNPHPPLTGFPFVLLTLVVVCEALRTLSGDAFYDRAVRFILVVVGVVSSLTYYSGYYGADIAKQTGVAETLIIRHQTLGQVYLIALIPTIILPFVYNACLTDRARRITRWTFRVSLFVCYSLAIITSFRGGELVFKYGAGVAR